MKRIHWLYTILGTLLITCISIAAQERGTWRAANQTAQNITGDITLLDEKITISFSSFPIARIRTLDPAEVGAVFDTDGNPAGKGSLYRLSVPASKKFLRRNALCGGEDTQWMAAYAAGHSLYLAFFSGQKAPVLTPEEITNSTDLCGTFIYLR